MSYWVRFEHNGNIGFGNLSRDIITIYRGDLFADAADSGKTVAVNEVKVLTPVTPGKMIVMFNNSHAIIAKKNGVVPDYPLFFLKPASSYLPYGESICLPRGHSSRVVLEGELGIVIGKNCKNVSVEHAPEYVFGYTCVNDVTAQDILEHPSLPQHVYSKAFDTFGVFGPAIATDIDPYDLVVESWLNGERCQQFSVRDYVFGPYELVSYLSRIMTLNPGDLISCGTSLGVMPLSAGDQVEVRIPGVGELVNPVA